MIALLWIVFTLLVLLWSGMIALAISASEWMLGLLTNNQLEQAAGDMSQMPIPSWLAPWIDPAMLEHFKLALTHLNQMKHLWLPAAEVFSSSVTGVMMTLWGIGFLILLLITTLIHWLIRKN